MSTTVCVLVFFLLATVTLTSAVGNIQTLANIANTAPQEAVSSSVASSSSTTTSNIFQGTGIVIGGLAVPNTAEAIRKARLEHFEGSEHHTGSILAQGAQELVHIAQNNVQKSKQVFDSTLGACLRSGAGCTGSVQHAARSAAAASTAAAQQNLARADGFAHVVEHIGSSNVIGLAMNAYSTVNAGLKEADDICTDDGIISVEPVITRSVGTLLNGVTSVSAFKACAIPAAAFGPISSIGAGIVCSSVSSYFGNQVVSSVTERVHGRRRALNHKEEVHKLFHTLMKIGTDSAVEFIEWKNTLIRDASTKGYLKDTAKNFKGLWDSLPEDFKKSWTDREQYKDIREQILANIEYGLKNTKHNNPFQPSSAQVSFLNNHILSKWCLPSNWDEWIEMWHHNDILYTGYELDVIGDQQKRAVEMANILAKLDLSHEITVTMMDGHGRQWLAALKEFKKRNFDLNKVKLRIVDINDDVNDWHEIFFPKGYTTVVRSTVADGGIYKEDVPTNGLLYMNFCGLDGTNDVLENRLNVLQENGVLRKTMVSLSSRGGKNPKTFDFLKSIGHEVCSRGSKKMGFHTFAFDKRE